ncbi:MAG: hypothetical protein A2W30_07315 [Ignavibacteria bacterium RBG_16_36_9]|nr:MAG: hypothetical protein A2W30_07315 [Ignavibacteria bacterium RBG_16_36_9]
MSSPAVSCILQDHEGYLWFGTFNSVEKYDGYSFISYKNETADTTSLNNGYVETIYEDHFGNIWVGTSEGLDKLNRTSGKFSHFIPDHQKIKKEGENHITAICEDKNGQIWVGSRDGLNVLNQSTGKFLHFNYDNYNPLRSFNYAINAIHEDREGDLWIGTGAGLDKFDTKHNKFTRYWFDQKNQSDWTNLWVNTIFEDKSGILWLGTRLGLVAFNKKDSTFISYGKELRSISSICEDESGNLWIGTWLDGLFSFDISSKIFTQYKNNSRDRESISHNVVTSVCYEKSGTLWIGTLGGGVNKLDKTLLLFTRYKHIEGDKESLYSNNVDCIFQGTRKEIFVVSDRGVELFNPNTESFKLLFYLPTVSQVVEDDNHNFWFGVSISEGLYKFDVHKNLKKYYYTWEQMKFPQDFSSMYKSNNGSIWIGTNYGAFFSFNPVSEIMTAIDLGITIYGIVKVFEDDSGLVWIGTQGAGLICYDPAKKTKINYTSESKNEGCISSNTVFSIHQDKTGTLWVGTNTGLNKYEPLSQTFSHFTEKNGLSNNIILTILEDDHKNLWLNTANGITKFNLENFQFKNYFLPYRLSGNWFLQPPGFRTKDGEMYFGGVNGLIRFHPDSIRGNEHIPSIVITSFKKFDKSYPLSDEIRLPYDENFISFEFASLSYISPERNQYAYKMEGLDKDWVYSGTRRYASYPNLDPGKYVFRVKGSNNDGIWNEAGTSISIIITPPWWKATWAYILYSILILSIIYFTWKMQVKRIRMSHEYEMNKFEAQKLQEVDELKSRFFANISHEFRTPLTLIIGPAKQIIESTKEEKTRENLKVMHKNANRLLGLVNQLLDISKLESGNMKLRTSPQNIIPLIKALALSFTSYAERKKITLKFNSFEDEIIVYIDKDKIEKIITNVLSNAFKFTPDGGRMEVTVQPTPRPSKGGDEALLKGPSFGGDLGVGLRSVPIKGFVEISIHDTGIGIPQEKLPKIFDRFYQVDASHTREQEGTGIGLSLTKELVELHKGTIEVESEEGKGTTFTISIPLGKEHLKPEEICEEAAEKEYEKVKDTIDLSIEEFVDNNEKHKSEIYSPEKSELPLLMIVEDNSDVRNYIKENLNKDYRILEAVDGEDGWNKAIDPAIGGTDLIVSDVMMPKMDGFKLCAKLKTDERTSHIPVILLTAKAGSSDKIEGFETGADDYIMKPFETEELKSRIKNLIVQRKRIHEHFKKHGLFEIEEKNITPIDQKFLHKAFDIIYKNISDTTFDLESFAESINLSRSVLHRKITSLTGESPGELIRRIRLKRAAQLIEQKFGNISEISLEVGFSNPSQFARSFQKEFGVAPSTYQQNFISNSH